MSFIEKQHHGNHEYYLVKNVRISPAKVKKYRIFLGRTIPENEVLRKYLLTIEKTALSEKFESKWLPKAILEKVDDLIAASMIDNTHTESIQPKDFLVRFTYNTNAIEGNMLNLRQTALILVDKVTPEGANAKDVMEALSSVDAWQYVNTYKGGAYHIIPEEDSTRGNKEYTLQDTGRLQGRLRFDRRFRACTTKCRRGSNYD